MGKFFHTGMDASEIEEHEEKEVSVRRVAAAGDAANACSSSLLLALSEKIDLPHSSTQAAHTEPNELWRQPTNPKWIFFRRNMI